MALQHSVTLYLGETSTPLLQSILRQEWHHLRAARSSCVPIPYVLDMGHNGILQFLQPFSYLSQLLPTSGPRSACQGGKQNLMQICDEIERATGLGSYIDFVNILFLTVGECSHLHTCPVV